MKRLMIRADRSDDRDVRKGYITDGLEAGFSGFVLREGDECFEELGRMDAIYTHDNEFTDHSYISVSIDGPGSMEDVISLAGKKKAVIVETTDWTMIPLENLILLKDNAAYHVGKCFENRHSEYIVRDKANNRLLKNVEVKNYRNMIARYFDVTRSQLLFSNGCLFIEGISECQLVETFSKLIGKSLIEHQIEIVDTDGTAFYQFLMLFNSSEDKKRLPIRAAFVTDEDQFTESKDKEFNLDALLVDNYTQLNALRNGINNGHKNGRVNNMLAMANGQAGIKICSGKKTLEYQICKANVTGNKDVIKANWLYELIKRENADDIGKVEAYIDSIGERDLNDMEQQNVALLMWKCLPGKAEFAQTLNSFLIDKIETGNDVKFTVPTYIQEAISHLVL